MADEPQIPVQLTTAQMEDLLQVLGAALVSNDPPIDKDDIEALYGLLEAIADEHTASEEDDDGTG